MINLKNRLGMIAPYSEKGQYRPFCDGEVRYKTNQFLMCECKHCGKIFGESKIVRK